MRILFLSERFPYPLHDGGNLRTYHLLAGLAAEHEVTLVAHAPPGGAAALPDFPLACRLVCVDKPSVLWRVGGRVYQGGRSCRSLFLAKNWSPPLLAAARRQLQQLPFDAIHWNHLDTACYALRGRWPQLKVFDTHNCLSGMGLQVARDARSWWRRRLFTYEARQLRTAESVICRHMDRNLVCSEDDATTYRQFCPEGRYTVIPNGVDTNFFHPQPGPQEAHSLVFTGAMNYFPNEQAAQFFCREILPRITADKKKVYFVGRQPTSAIRALHDGQRVIVTGEVADVRPYVQRSQVYIVPLQHGSGTRLKILEAMAMGKAVVSTPLGAEGIPVRHGQHLLLADSAEQFSRSVDELLANDRQREQLGAAARKFATDHFDWTEIQSAVRQLYRDAVEAPNALCN
ncbi:MAG: glycosyltransferase [Planctomycetales bacterium]|nr:glycosyltransferase [Planctomycetales bacterium]